MATFLLLIYSIYLTSIDGSPVPQLIQPGQYIPARNPNIPIIQQRGLLNDPNIDAEATQGGGYNAPPLAGYCPMMQCGSGCHQDSLTCRCTCVNNQRTPELAINPNYNIPPNFGGGGYMPLPEPFILPSNGDSNNGYLPPTEPMIPFMNYGQQPEHQSGSSIRVKVRVTSQGEQPLLPGSVPGRENQPIVNVVRLPTNAVGMAGNRVRISLPFSSLKL